MTTITTVNPRDFITGLLAGLAAEDANIIETKNLNQAFVAAHEALGKDVLTFDLNKDDAADLIIESARSGLVFFNANGTLTVDIDKDYLGSYFDNLPLNENEWRKAAKVVIDSVINSY